MVLPPEGTCCPVYSQQPQAQGTWLPGPAIYTPKKPGEGAERRTHPLSHC